MAKEFHDCVMLTSLHMSRWGASKLEKGISDDVAEKHNAERNAGRYVKKLMSGNAFKKINAAYNKAKNTQVLLTLPWDDNGTRIISTKAYAEYAQQMNRCKNDYNAAVHEFCHEDYLEHVNLERKRLGDMFNEKDYPTANEIVGKFGMDVEVTELPRHKDLRVDISAEVAKAIAQDIEKRTEVRVNKAVNSIYERIADVTKKMHEKLSEYKTKKNGGKGSGFHDSLVSNVLELADILPEINITDDKRINELHKQLKEDLCQHSAVMLKTRDDLRSETARKAKKIYDKVSDYM